MFGCRPCCAEPADSFEPPPCTVQAERVLPLDDGDARLRQDAGTFDEDAGAEVFGRQAAAPKAEQTAQQVHPPRAPQTANFVARVQFARDRGMGMSLDITPKDRLRISNIDDDGPIAEYNKGAEERLQVMEGDFITSVNGSACDSKSKVATMMTGGLVVLEIRRAHCFVVRGLDATQGKLGLDLTFHAKGRAAYIKAVFSEGLMHSHNLASPESEVRSGDLIVAVNGRAGSSRDLVDLISSGGKLDLTISRPDEQ